MATTEPLSWAITDADRQARSPMPTFRRCSRGPDGATPSGQIAPTPPQLEQAPRGPFRHSCHRREGSAERHTQKVPSSDSRHAHAHKTDCGNVMPYGPILMESLAP